MNLTQSYKKRRIIMLKTSYKVEQEVDELAQEALDKYDIEESDETSD